VRAQLQTQGFSDIIQTAFIERLNLSVRHGIAALAHRSWATCCRHDRLHPHIALCLSTISCDQT
jgi:IS1 family transposase